MWINFLPMDKTDIDIDSASLSVGCFANSIEVVLVTNYDSVWWFIQYEINICIVVVIDVSRWIDTVLCLYKIKYGWIDRRRTEGMNEHSHPMYLEEYNYLSMP